MARRAREGTTPLCSLASAAATTRHSARGTTCRWEGAYASNPCSWCKLAQVTDSHHSLPLTPHALHACLQVGPFSFTAASAAVVPGRVAYLLGYSGASAAVDTACSASLVACHMAVSELRAGRSQRAVAAGVMLQLVPQSALMVVG